MGIKLHYQNSILRITLLLILLYIAFAIPKISNPLKSLQQQIQAKKKKKKSSVLQYFSCETETEQGSEKNAIFTLKIKPPLCSSHQLIRREQRITIISAANAVSLLCFWELQSQWLCNQRFLCGEYKKNSAQKKMLSAKELNGSTIQRFLIFLMSPRICVRCWLM